ncbi:MAG: tetratricopeptide repeat protein [Propionivibrio sp.]|nr:tetratricopeptide repeat protein [Propionivibrio sp.]
MEALTQLNSIQAPDDDNANLQYNLGLLFFKLKDYKESLKHAQKAYQLGFPLSGLREVEAAGKWKEHEPIKPETSSEEGQMESAPAPK